MQNFQILIVYAVPERRYRGFVPVPHWGASRPPGLQPQVKIFVAATDALSVVIVQEFVKKYRSRAQNRYIYILLGKSQ